MNHEQRKSHIAMLRAQRAQVQANVAACAHDRATKYRELVAADLHIADLQEIVADMDSQIAAAISEHWQERAAGPVEDPEKPMRPLGKDGAMIEVHKTTAWVYDQVTKDGVFEINPTTNPSGIPYLRRAIKQIVAAGVAYGQGENGLVLRP